MADIHLQFLEERFKRIYYENKDRLYHFVKKFTRDPGSVEDLVQECFIKIWNNLDDVRDDETIYPLLRTYAQYIVINHNQREARRLLRDERYGKSMPVVNSFESALEAKDEWEQYKEVINTLPPQRRKVYLLQKEQGYSYQEIANELHLSIKTIEKHITKANQELRERFPEGRLALFVLLLSLQVGVGY